MTSKFVVKRNGVLEEYSDFNKIPWDFDHLICFKPELPPLPHTEEEHKLLNEWNNKLQALIKIERFNHASRNKNR